MKRNKGFTLVELLAVIVILAIILVIAVPKVMSVIEDSKKATLESTAKMIASAAEKAKVQNTVLGKTEEITCDSVAKINDLDYDTCDIDFDDNKALVSIKGSGKFAGLYVCNGTKTDAEATKEECSSPLEVKHPLFLAGHELTPDKFEVTLTESDGSKRILSNGSSPYIDYSKSVTITSPNWPENYPSSMKESDNYWEYTFDGAEAIQITFDETSETYDKNYTYVAIYDKDGNKLYQLGGKDFAGETYTIIGEYIKVTMYVMSGPPAKKGFSAEIKPTYITPCEYTISPSVVPDRKENFDITITLKNQNISKKITTTIGPYDLEDYVTRLEPFENNVQQKKENYNGTRYNAGIRYVGAKDDVKNKVYYNCDDRDTSGVAYGETNYDYANSCEVWRIIGVFDTKSSTTNGAVPRVKLINAESTFTAPWDSSASDVNSGYGVNQWGKVGNYNGADLMQMLNGYYIGKENTNCTYCNDSGQEICEQTCTTQSLKDSNMKVLTTNALGKIDNAVWDTYAVNGTDVPITDSKFARTAFLEEKGISQKYTGISYCSNCNDGVTRTISWTGLVGLMSVSDMLYADGWLYNPSGTSLYPWSITPFANFAYSCIVWRAGDTNAKNYFANVENGVFPSVYLKPGVKVISGNGDTEPYILAM